MKHQEVKSSNIATIGYDGPTQILEVRFKTGLLYRYEHVPVVLHLQLMSAHSKGQYFSKHVRNNTNFPCSLVKEEKQVELKEPESKERKPYPPKNVGFGIVNIEKLKEK